ncbi:hypothetical protein ACIG3E_33380 [Streptomyces sp. NPDC053474]|uniref:hypothetical protein n=1 Tax=Streptomyces sp. NPDC053474 TaxID=3365704 RepID=UPI0037D68799
MAVKKPTKAQTAATANLLVGAGWAEWGEENGLKRPLTITDTGRAQRDHSGPALDPATVVMLAEQQHERTRP